MFRQLMTTFAVFSGLSLAACGSTPYAYPDGDDDHDDNQSSVNQGLGQQGGQNGEQLRDPSFYGVLDYMRVGNDGSEFPYSFDGWRHSMELDIGDGYAQLLVEAHALNGSGYLGDYYSVQTVPLTPDTFRMRISDGFDGELICEVVSGNNLECDGTCAGSDCIMDFMGP